MSKRKTSVCPDSVHFHGSRSWRSSSLVATLSTSPSTVHSLEYATDTLITTIPAIKRILVRDFLLSLNMLTDNISMNIPLVYSWCINTEGYQTSIYI